MCLIVEKPYISLFFFPDVLNGEVIMLYQQFT